ncbi:hypothetical protein KI387_015970 [Taxus chinensis]|uniref:Uncharacterized protein n=1 Tax=Taxus chinensis TaxID=29808 RepID=A0AA38GDQ1_TAXCH|nr:hypothetical protein KI387_015970 [Taxus chinensis]
MSMCTVAGLLSKARRIPFKIQTLILSIHQYPPGCESQQLEMQNGEISGKFGGGGGGDHGSAQEFSSQAHRGGSGCSALSDRECGYYTVHMFVEFVEAGEASRCAWGALFSHAGEAENSNGDAGRRGEKASITVPSSSSSPPDYELDATLSVMNTAKVTENHAAIMDDFAIFEPKVGHTETQTLGKESKYARDDNFKQKPKSIIATRRSEAAPRNLLAKSTLEQRSSFGITTVFMLSPNLMKKRANLERCSEDFGSTSEKPRDAWQQSLGRGVRVSPEDQRGNDNQVSMRPDRTMGRDAHFGLFN